MFVDVSCFTKIDLRKKPRWDILTVKILISWFSLYWLYKQKPKCYWIGTEQVLGTRVDLEYWRLFLRSNDYASDFCSMWFISFDFCEVKILKVDSVNVICIFSSWSVCPIFYIPCFLTPSLRSCLVAGSFVTEPVDSFPFSWLWLWGGAALAK